MSLSLSRSELTLIYAALMACSPMGGGSNQFTLARKIGAALPANVTGPALWSLIGSLQAEAAEVYNEAMSDAAEAESALYQKAA